MSWAGVYRSCELVLSSVGTPTYSGTVHLSYFNVLILSIFVSFWLFMAGFTLFASLSLFFCRIQRVMHANCLLLCVSLCFFLSRKSANLLFFVCCCPYDSAFIANLLAF